jgi:hypothetical protein
MADKGNGADPRVRPTQQHDEASLLKPGRALTDGTRWSINRGLVKQPEFGRLLMYREELDELHTP